ncbi:hypothetical protein Pla144_01760 [Bythopirellula polymerisocia]|uniref:Uncharacterized protein n=1 Tax=Bythopirellula polymerisocia TaxID=2528003 RepID=A0A5C6CYC2_9BACT|nr:hypothetical protein Pla144_01760 [Bythopirellula polymerisocia]
MKNRIAIALSIVIGLIFIHAAVFSSMSWSGFFLKAILLGIGTGIVFSRAWSFYIAYVLFILNSFNLLAWLPLNQAPYSNLIGIFSYIDIPLRISSAMICLSLLAMTGWTHCILFKNDHCNEPVSFDTHRKRLKAVAILSGLLIVGPIALFILGIIWDPPGGRNPGGFSPGFVPFLALIVTGPLIPIGFVGMAFLSYIRKRSVNRSNLNSLQHEKE